MTVSYPFKQGVTGSELPLNVNPYFSRSTLFNFKGATAKNYVMIAFKPGLPLQASELNEMQEIEAINQTLTATMVNSWPVFTEANAGVMYGPGWDGATPIQPQGISPTTTSLVTYSNGGFTANPGWYLIQVASSKLKHWVHLNTTLSITANASNTIGFFVDYEIVKPTSDTSFYDNSTGTESITPGAAAGADRIHVKIYGLTASQGATNFSPIAKINSDGALFMNNVTVPAS
jgi:hypothetical protein